MRTRRSSTQAEQELKSRHQLAERLIDFGWHHTSPSPDLGEDFIVEIYTDGQNTGVTFYIQEKSVTNLPMRKSKEYLVYPLKVKDLKHWEGFSLPVVIVVWDIKLREGRWGLVRDLISYLDKNNRKWRNNKKKVQVYIPWENGTDDNGLNKLKREIGRQVYPLISSGKDLSMEMELAFPDTTAGKKLRKAFDLHIKEGEPVTISGNVIQKLEFTDWWEEWFGGFDLAETEIQIGKVSPQRNVPISFRILPTKGDAIPLSITDFRLIQSGTELIQFSNAHTTCPLLVTFSLRKRGDLLDCNLNYLFRHVGGDPYDLKNYLDFVNALTIGGKLQINFLDDKQFYSTDFPPVKTTGADPGFYDLIKKLCNVQDKIGRFFQIPENGISSKNANSIWELFEIIEHGNVHYQDGTMSISIKDNALKMLLETHKEGKPIHLRFTAPDSFVELFEKTISVGPMVREITGNVEMGVKEFEKTIQSLKPGEFLEVKLVKVNGRETFSNWKPS